MIMGLTRIAHATQFLLGCWRLAPGSSGGVAARRRRGVVAAGGAGGWFGGGVVLRSGGIGLVWRAASRARES